MTTLDDAAERQRQRDEIAGIALAVTGAPTQEAREQWIQLAWERGAKAATEAAAKKCEAEKVDADFRHDDEVAHNRACDDCAAAIRGKP